MLENATLSRRLSSTAYRAERHAECHGDRHSDRHLDRLGHSRSEPRLLVIDDDNFTLMAVRRKIRQLGLSIDFDHASDGIEGMQALWHPVLGAPATILLDYHMPRMNGVEMLCRMEAIAERQSIDVYLTTSSDIPRSSFDGVAGSVAGFIVKDLGFQGLEAALIRHQARQAHLAQTG